MGHVGSTKWGPGAPYEEEHIKLVVPYIVKRLQEGGVQVDVFGGDMPFGMTHDMFMAVHCDSDGGAFAWSLGFRDDTHPGSSGYAHVVRDHYAMLAPGPYSENITPGEHHYNGFSHFVVATKCALIELQFVSNQRGRSWIEAQPDKLGYAVADGMLAYAGREVKKVPTISSSRTVESRGKVFDGHATIGQNGPGVEDCWLHFTAVDVPATINVLVMNDTVIKQLKDDTKNPLIRLVPNKRAQIALSGFGISGDITWIVTSDVPIIFSPDWRVTT